MNAFLVLKEYSMDIFMRQWWHDPRFKNNYSKPFNMAADPTKLFWTPDTYFWNVKDAKYHHVTRENMRVKISPDGEVYYSTRYNDNTKLDGSLGLSVGKKKLCFLCLHLPTCKLFMQLLVYLSCNCSSVSVSVFQRCSL